MSVNSYSEAYAALGVPFGADFLEVKRAWRVLAKYHHPDVLIDPTEREDATERLKTYNAAFELLRSYWDLHGSMPEDTAFGSDTECGGSAATAASADDQRQSAEEAKSSSPQPFFASPLGDDTKLAVILPGALILGIFLASGLASLAGMGSFAAYDTPLGAILYLASIIYVGKLIYRRFWPDGERLER